MFQEQQQHLNLHQHEPSSNFLAVHRTGSIRAAEVDRMDAGSRRKSSGVGDNPPHCQDENGGQLLGNEVFSICDTFEKKSCREET